MSFRVKIQNGLLRNNEFQYPFNYIIIRSNRVYQIDNLLGIRKVVRLKYRLRWVNSDSLTLSYLQFIQAYVYMHMGSSQSLLKCRSKVDIKCQTTNFLDSAWRRDSFCWHRKSKHVIHINIFNRTSTKRFVHFRCTKKKVKCTKTIVWSGQ